MVYPSSSHDEKPPPRMSIQSHRNYAFLALSFALSGCGPCTSPPNPTEAPPAPRPMAPMLAPPAPLHFKPFRAARSGIALPSGCSLRERISEADLPKLTRFVSEPRTLGMLLIAQAEGDPPKLSGVGAFEQMLSGEMKNPKPFPWFVAEDMPVFTRSEAHGFIAANETQIDETIAKVELIRDGKAETVGEGDHFHAVDIACEKDQCALLTTRMAKVAAAGATLWLGQASAPFSQWKSIDIIPPEGDTRANPIGFAHGAYESYQIDSPSTANSTGSNTQTNSLNTFPPPIALTTKTSLLFYQAGSGDPKEIARLPAPYGTLDVLSAPLPIAMVYGNPVNENGCIARPEQNEAAPAPTQEEPQPAGSADEAPDTAPPQDALPKPAKGALVRFERAGAPGIEIPVPTPPILGALRRLEQGVLALWIAPLGCEQSRRVVYGLVLDPSGNPLQGPIPIADAEHFAASSKGNTVDLWLQRDASLSFVPLRCAASAAP